MPFYNVLQTLMNYIIPSNEYIGLVNRFEMRPMPLDYIDIAMNVHVDIKVKFWPIFVASFVRKAVHFSNLISKRRQNLIRIDTKVPKGNEIERKAKRFFAATNDRNQMNDEYIDRTRIYPERPKQFIFLLT